MSLTASEIRVRDALNEAIGAGDWARAARTNERLLEILLTAFSRSEAGRVEEIQDSLARASDQVALRHNVSPDPSPNSIFWTLKAGALFASLAVRQKPPRPLDITNEDAASVRTLVLRELARSNRPRLSNRALAGACRAREETLARVLPRLRDEGLVSSWRAGKRMLNEITESGRYALRALPIQPQSEVSNIKTNGGELIKYRSIATAKNIQSQALPPNIAGEIINFRPRIAGAISLNEMNSSNDLVANLKSEEVSHEFASHLRKNARRLMDESL